MGDNIKMDLEEVGGGCGDWMEFVQERDDVSTLRKGIIVLPYLHISFLFYNPDVENPILGSG
jgi:hypothetical protein